MKVSLIQPIHADYKVVKKRKGGIFKPSQLTMPYIAACTPRDFDVEIHDEIIGPINPEKINGDVVGITAVTPFVNRAYELAGYFRARGQTVILGGPHVSALPREAVHHADSVIVGEGDHLWPRALQDWKKHELKPLYRNEAPLTLRGLPAPRWDLLSPEDYIIPQVVQASRGCPFACDFCSLRTVFPTYRTRPIRDIIEEVERIPYRNILFWDDNITGNPHWARQLFRELTPLNKRWYGQSTITIAQSEELVQLAGKSGCSGLFIGLESFSPKSLREVGKGFNQVLKYKQNIGLLRDHGIGVISGIMFGFDGDTLDTFEATLEGTIKIGLAGIACSIVTPYPGTPLFERMNRGKRLITCDWSRYTSDEAVFIPKNMTARQLVEGHNWVGQNFYTYASMVRRYWGSRFFYHPTPSQMLNNAVVYWGLNLANRRYFDDVIKAGEHPASGNPEKVTPSLFQG
jgi:radical SAM superfamily enzyme YgiQ (UPF0313 family)